MLRSMRTEIQTYPPYPLNTSSLVVTHLLFNSYEWGKACFCKIYFISNSYVGVRGTKFIFLYFNATVIS